MSNPSFTCISYSLLVSDRFLFQEIVRLYIRLKQTVVSNIENINLIDLNLTKLNSIPPPPSPPKMTVLNRGQQVEFRAQDQAQSNM